MIKMEVATSVLIIFKCLHPQREVCGYVVICQWGPLYYPVTLSCVISLLLCSLNAFQAPVYCVMLLVMWMTPCHLCLGSVWDWVAAMAGTSVSVSPTRPALMDSAIITRWPLCLNAHWVALCQCVTENMKTCILYNILFWPLNMKCSHI